MRKFNKIFILLAFFGLSIVSTAQVVDSGTCGDNLTWELTGSGDNLTLTISGTGAMTDYGWNGNSLDVPWYSQNANIKTLVLPYGITTIGNYAFRECRGLTGITIPNSVELIGEGAFGYCSGLIGTLIIPNSVISIGQFAFEDCSGLTGITIPNSVISIGKSAFIYCKNLTAIDVETNNQYYSSNNGVLFNKNKTILIKCPEGKSGNYNIPNSVISIEQSAFWYCRNLLELIIPNSVISIGQSVFYYCISLTDIYVSWETPVSIGTNVFASVNRQNVKLHIPEGTKPTYQDAPVWQDFILLDGTEASINELKANIDIKIYPNPVQNELKVESEFKINNVEICDLAGRIVLIPHSSFFNSINVSALPQGVYLVKIYTDKGVVTQKVVKN